MSTSRIFVSAKGDREDLQAMDDAMPIAPLMSVTRLSRGIDVFEQFVALREETSKICYTEPTLIVVRHGHGTVFTHENRQKKTHHFQSQSIGFFPKGFEHLCSPSTGNDFFCLTLSERLLRETSEEVSPAIAREEWNPVLGVRDDVLNHLVNTLSMLAEERSQSRLLFETLAQSILLRLVEVAAAERYDFGNQRPNSRVRARSLAGRRIERVIEALRSNPAENSGLVEMAELASLSPAYFSRTFKCFTGMSPSEFQTRERIGMAERMMVMDDRSLSEIAAVVGFHSVQGLRRAFQRVKGRPMRRWADTLRDTPNID